MSLDITSSKIFKAISNAKRKAATKICKISLSNKVQELINMSSGFGVPTITTLRQK